MKTGSGLVELIIAVALFSFIIVTLIVSISSMGIVQLKNKQRFYATQLATRNIEIAHHFSQVDWDTLSALDGTFHPELDIDQHYQLIPGAGTHDIFTMSLIISPAYRDENDNPAPSGTPDPNTISVTSNVTWNFSNSNEQVTFTSYFINLNEPD